MRRRRITAPLACSDAIEASDPTENNAAAEPTDPTERIEPIEPIESAEPIEPIDSTEPREPIEGNECCDHSDHFEFSGCVCTVFRRLVPPAQALGLTGDLRLGDRAAPGAVDTPGVQAEEYAPAE